MDRSVDRFFFFFFFFYLAQTIETPGVRDLVHGKVFSLDVARFSASWKHRGSDHDDDSVRLVARSTDIGTRRRFFGYTHAISIIQGHRCIIFYLRERSSTILALPSFFPSFLFSPFFPLERQYIIAKTCSNFSFI